MATSNSAELGKVPANFAALTPIGFLARTAHVHPSLPSAVYGEVSYTWHQTYERCRRFASALKGLGIRRGDSVAVMLPNVPAMFELHFAVPMAGAVLCAINTRLDVETVVYILGHSEAKVVLVDPEFAATMHEALGRLGTRAPIAINVADIAAPCTDAIGDLDYEALILLGDSDFEWMPPDDEWDTIALNYTSGTTGKPKGVACHHRGAHLSAVNNALYWSLPCRPVYLWVLPMFHCNGWCFPWTLALVAGVSIFLRKFDPSIVFDAIGRHGVTHMCAAPIVYAALTRSGLDTPQLERKVHGLIAGSAPPAAVLEGASALGFDLTHVYGLTEVYGPSSVCVQQPDWLEVSHGQQMQLRRRQGVVSPMQGEVAVLDPETLQAVPHDLETMGEVMFRGNLVMKGYFKDPDATEAALSGGWFHTGDLAVVDSDGYLVIKDRAKDIIVSGGENISSVEIEEALYGHPAVMVAAVVPEPDSKWGETPCAFVELKAGAKVSEAELMAFCRERLAGFKMPKRLVFGFVPKTSTGKVMKFELRARVNSARAVHL